MISTDNIRFQRLTRAGSLRGIPRDRAKGAGLLSRAPRVGNQGICGPVGGGPYMAKKKGPSVRLLVISRP